MVSRQDDETERRRNRFQDDDEEGGDLPAPGWRPKVLFLRLKNIVQKDRKRYAVAASAMLALGFLFFLLWSVVVIIEMRRPTVEMAVEALDLGAYEQARTYATSVLKYAQKGETEKRGTALYVLGVATCEEVDRAWLADKTPFFREAADALTESRELGFMPDRDTDGYFYLGKSLFFSRNFPEAIVYLEIARDKRSPRQKNIDWYLANAYFQSPQPDYRKGLEALDRFEAQPPFVERERQAGTLLRTFFNLRLDQLSAAKASFERIPTLTDPGMILYRELAAGKICMQQSVLFRSRANELEKTSQLSLPQEELDKLEKQLKETPLQETPPPVPVRERPASPFQQELEHIREGRRYLESPDETTNEDATSDDADAIQQISFAETQGEDPVLEPVERQSPQTSKDIVIATWRQLATQQLREAVRHFEIIKRDDTELLDLYRQAAFLEAMCFEELGEFERAQEEYYSLARTFPGTPEAAASQFRWGYIEHVIKNNPKAGLASLARFFEMLDRQDNYANSWMTVNDITNAGLGEVEKLVESGQYAKAEELLGYFLRIVPKERQARLFSRIFMQWGEQLENRSEDKKSDEQRKLLRQAEEKFRLAGKWYEELAKWTFDAPEYLTKVWAAAENYERGRDFPRAMAMYRLYLEHEFVLRQAQSHFHIGDILFEMNEINAAVKELEYCLESFPDDPVVEQARLTLACAYQEKKQWDRAARLLKENLDGKYDPTSEVFRDSLYELGRVYDHMHENAEMIEVFNEVLTLYPEDPKTAEAHYLIAKASLDEEAKLNDLMSREQLPNRIELDRRTLAETQRTALGHLKQARTILMREEERHGLDDAGDRMLRNTYFLIGRVLTAMGPEYYEEALQENKTAVARYLGHPDVLQAYLQLARVYQLQGQPDQADRIITQAENLLKRFIAAKAFRQDTVYTERQWQELLGTP